MMFFIFGSPRSGTTLLAQCLDAHPEITIPHETDFIVPAALVFERVPDPAIRTDILKLLITKSAGFEASIGEYLSIECVEQIINDSANGNLAALLEALYGNLAKSAGKRIAGDKSPNDLAHAFTILNADGIGAETRVLHLVRDVRDVIVSLWELRWLRELNMRQFPRTWSHQNLGLFRNFADNANYMLIRYEDFVRNPPAKLREICTLLGVEYVPDLIDPANRSPRLKNVPHHHRLYEPISTTQIGRFKSALTADTIATYEAQAYPSLKQFGYEFLTPVEKLSAPDIQDRPITLPVR